MVGDQQPVAAHILNVFEDFCKEYEVTYPEVNKIKYRSKDKQKTSECDILDFFFNNPTWQRFFSKHQNADKIVEDYNCKYNEKPIRTKEKFFQLGKKSEEKPEIFWIIAEELTEEIYKKIPVSNFRDIPNYKRFSTIFDYLINQPIAVRKALDPRGYNKHHTKSALSHYRSNIKDNLDVFIGNTYKNKSEAFYFSGGYEIFYELDKIFKQIFSEDFSNKIKIKSFADKDNKAMHVGAAKHNKSHTVVHFKGKEIDPEKYPKNDQTEGLLFTSTQVFSGPCGFLSQLIVLDHIQQRLSVYIDTDNDNEKKKEAIEGIKELGFEEFFDKENNLAVNMQDIRALRVFLKFFVIKLEEIYLDNIKKQINSLNNDGLKKMFGKEQLAFLQNFDEIYSKKKATIKEETMEDEELEDPSKYEEEEKSSNSSQSYSSSHGNGSKNEEEREKKELEKLEESNKNDNLKQEKEDPEINKNPSVTKPLENPIDLNINSIDNPEEKKEEQENLNDIEDTNKKTPIKGTLENPINPNDNEKPLIKFEEDKERKSEDYDKNNLEIINPIDNPEEKKEELEKVEKRQKISLKGFEGYLEEQESENKQEDKKQVKKMEEIIQNKYISVSGFKIMNQVHAPSYKTENQAWESLKKLAEEDYKPLDENGVRRKKIMNFVIRKVVNKEEDYKPFEHNWFMRFFSSRCAREHKLYEFCKALDEAMSKNEYGMNKVTDKTKVSMVGEFLGSEDEYSKAIKIIDNNPAIKNLGQRFTDEYVYTQGCFSCC